MTSGRGDDGVNPRPAGPSPTPALGCSGEGGTAVPVLSREPIDIRETPAGCLDNQWAVWTVDSQLIQTVRNTSWRRSAAPYFSLVSPPRVGATLPFVVSTVPLPSIIFGYQTP